MALTFLIRFYWLSAREQVSWGCPSVMNFEAPHEAADFMTAWSATKFSWSPEVRRWMEFNQQGCSCQVMNWQHLNPTTLQRALGLKSNNKKANQVIDYI